MKLAILLDIVTLCLRFSKEKLGWNEEKEPLLDFTKYFSGQGNDG